MKKQQWVWAIIALIVVFGGLFGGKWLMDRRAAAAAAAASQPPVTVSTAVAVAAEWDPDVSVVGTLAALEGTHVTAQIAGNITRIAFRPGSRVAKGALLVQLDDSTQQAQLHADEARLALAESELKRARALRAENATSEAVLQEAEAARGTSLAAVEGDRATLAKLRITAPFAGVVGVREVSPGQYVSPGTPIVLLQSLDSLLLNFALPQQVLADLAVGDPVRFEVDSYPGEVFGGRITALDPGIDPETRNISIQATLVNRDGRLRPGLYGSVSLRVGKRLAGVALPETAIAYSTFGDTVYVVGEEQGGRVAHARTVTIVDTRDGKVLISSGVKAGDVVVSVGQNRLRDGVPVTLGGNQEANQEADQEAAAGK